MTTAAKEALEAFKHSDNWSEWVCDYQKEIITALQDASQSKDAWLPIESAPRDGTYILAMEKWSDSPAIVKFRNNKWAQYSDGMPVEDLDANILCLHEEGMVWQPLPAAPKAEQEGG
jgi:hypothetical protein